jgi:alpha-L-fucosidase
MLRLSRRDVLVGGGAAALAGGTFAQPFPGPVTPSWESLASHYRVPEWFRDAKFGIWAHWGPQCQPEWGDWYARLMYQPGRQPWFPKETAYEHHLKHYGHPSRTGFIDVIGRWKAENWDPAYLSKRYAAAGARYFMAMACHHDNFDNFASRHHAWNSTRVGPKRDILAGWQPAVAQAGMKFGVSNHSSHAWHWYQVAYGYDPEGPMRGKRYDAYWLTKRHGRGKFWEGLDPQELYTGRYYVAPDGIRTNQAMWEWHDKRDGQWIEAAPPFNPQFVRKWLLRQNQMVDDYQPDLIYFDDSGLPLGQAGLDAVAHYYNRAVARRGETDVVVFGKTLNPLQRRAIVEDVERGWLNEIRAEPWQTDTCIGNWHYSRRIYAENAYKTPKQVVQRLADVVSKNGNLLLNIPVRGDGTIDEKEAAIVEDIGTWMRRNGEAIFGTRPWRTFGEGSTRPAEGILNEDQAKPFGPEDIRFTRKGEALYAIFLERPTSKVAIKSLGTRRLPLAVIENVELLGGPPLQFSHNADALQVVLPRLDAAIVPAVRIRGRGLT